MNLLDRRTILRGLGAAISLPLLDAMLPSFGVSTAHAAPSKFQPVTKSLAQQPRMICCYVPNGVNILEWMPEQAGPEYKLSPTLETLAEHRTNFSVLTGLGHKHSEGGHSGADTWLTGANLKGMPGSDYSNTISDDQIIASHHSKATRFASLQLSDRSGTGSAGHSHTLSFNATGTPIPAEDSPQRLFERLFVPESAADRAATLRRYAEKKSVLDNVLSESRRLRNKLGEKDQQKLDQYLESVRETELRVHRMQEWIDIPRPEVDAKLLQLGSRPGDAHDRPMWIDVMLELSYLAFQTDTTRVITFEWSREAGGYGGGGENHHELSHHGGDADMLRKLGVIDRFHLARLARFMTFLKETSDGEGNMLDHTMILYGSGMNSGKGGEHSPKNLPLLMAGGQRLGFRHGRHLAFKVENHPPLANVLLTMMQAMGIESDKFSDATGTLTELTTA